MSRVQHPADPAVIQLSAEPAAAREHCPRTPLGPRPRHQFTTYKLDFFTSTLRGAGTDATVYFQLFGDKVSGEARLEGGLPLAGGMSGC